VTVLYAEESNNYKPLPAFENDTLCYTRKNNHASLVRNLFAQFFSNQPK